MKSPPDSDASPENVRTTARGRPRERALSPALLARVFHQPSLVYFYTVAEHLSMREAARQLNVASSAVARQITSLEDAIGMALFQRENRHLKLLPAGEILYRHARSLISMREAVVSELDMLRGLETGTIRLAAVESIGLSFLPRLIAEFGQRYPRLHFDVTITSAADVIARVLDERVEIGLGFITGRPKGIDVGLRRDVRIGALMRPGHPLAENPTVTLAACLKHNLAIGRPEISIREVIEPFLQRSAPTSPPFVEVDSIRMLVELALIGLHISIMTPIGAQNEIERGELVFRPLSDPGLPANRFALMVRSASALHFAPAVFHDYAMRHFEKIQLPGAV